MESVQSEWGKIIGIMTKERLLHELSTNDLIEHNLENIPLEFGVINNELNESTACRIKDSQSQQLIGNGHVNKENSAESLIKFYKKKYIEKESIFRSALNGIIMVDKNGVIRDMNPAALALTRLVYNQTIGKRPEEVGLPTNYMHILKGGKAEIGVRLNHNGRNYLVSRSPIVIDGEILGAVSIFQDVTRFKDLSSQLVKEQELNYQLETVINSSFDGIIVTDYEGNILKINKAALKVIGISKETEELPEWILLLINDVKSKTQAITYTTKNHLDNQLVITANPVYDGNNNITRFVFNIRDISELSVLKHELKNTKELTQKYLQELDRLQNEKKVSLVARSKSMKQIVDLSLRLAEVDTTVLILGETGVGKQVIAKLIHDNSQRRNQAFVDINCGAIPENLLESELFGYESGTFTGGLKAGKIGLFELANGGTIFLDEIGDLPYSLQVKLLKVLQNREIQRVGGLKPSKIDARVITATNKNLEAMVKEGKFREDLFYRLNIVPIMIPSLRDRKEDILPLIFQFKHSLEEKYGKQIDFTPESYELFLNYDWPGNVRQLQNIIERLFVTANSSTVDYHQVIPQFVKLENSDLLMENILNSKDTTQIMPLKEAVELLELNLIKLALEKYGSTYKAAKALGVNQSTVSRKAQKINGQKQLL